MRFTRITPENADELRDAILEDLESLEPGMRSVATRVPVSGRGVIDLFASDERGRLAVVSFCLAADPGAVARAVDQWDWTVANMGLLRALVPVVGLDLTLAPRALLVCESIDDNVRRFAACLPSPGLEIFETTIISAGEGRGLLVDRVTDDAPHLAAGSAIERALEAIASDQARALTRRLFEELQETTEGGGPFTAVRLQAAFDIRRDGRDLATLAAAADGLAIRWIDHAQVLEVSDDAGCREAVRLLASPAGKAQQAPQSRGITPGPVAAALTAEEVAEFERLRSDPEALRGAGPEAAQTSETARPDTPRGIETPEPPAVRVLRTGFMEN